MILQEMVYSWKDCTFETSSVQEIFCAFEETFVLGTWDHLLLHVDRHGVVIRKLQLTKESSMTMISDHEVIVGTKTRIWLIDLQDDDKDKVFGIVEEKKEHCSCHDPLKLFSQRSECFCFFFEKTQLFCLAAIEYKMFTEKEDSDVDSHSRHTTLKVTYLPITSIYSETTEGQTVQNLDFDEHRQVIKADNSSSISTISRSYTKLFDTKF